MRGLVLSGGGSKGAWQAGVLAGLLPFAKGFDVISGTSVGALNAAGLAMSPSTEIGHGVNRIARLWCEEDLTGIWSWRFPPYAAGLWSPSLGKNEGLRELLDRVLKADDVRRSGVKLRITAANVETGRLEIFTESSPDLHKAVLASSSFPVVFPMERIGKSYYTDGGVAEIAPLNEVIKAGADEVLVISCSDPFHPEHEELPKTAVKMLMRVIDMMTTEILHDDLLYCGKINRELPPGKQYITVRIVVPSKPLGDSLDFRKELMRERFQQGLRDAHTVRNISGA